MARNGPIERLRQFLRELSPQARALLITELERAALRGDDIPGGDLVLQEVRNAIRDAGIDAPRVGNPARLFFRPFEAFLMSGQSRTARPGRIPREALDPLWTWLVRDLIPHEVRLYSEDVSRALGAGEIARADLLVSEFQDLVAGHIRDALAAGKADDKVQRRIAAQVNIPHALRVLDEVLVVLQERNTLDLLAQRLPAHIQNLSGPELESVESLLDVMIGQRPNALRLSLVLVMRRLAAPWQLIRLALHTAGSNDMSRLAASRFGESVTLVLTEVEEMLAELVAELRRAGEMNVVSLLKSLHDALRGLRTELDLSVDPLARQTASIRTQIADSLTAAIDPLPGRIRQMLRMRPAKEASFSKTPDAADIAEICSLIELAKASRNFAREFAVAELAVRVWSELEDSLDVHTRALIASLRGDDPHHEHRQAQFQAALRFAALIFGPDHATRLSRSAELAVAERKTAAG